MAEDHFGESVAARFDERYAHQADPAVVGPIVDFLVELAAGGAALELGIGTGRIALPLAARGVPVHGIELSEAMLARLRAKPGAERIGVTVGDFATATVEATFTVAYLVANTIMNLTTQDEQVACFQNVAAHLEPGGCFVIEVLVPGLETASARRAVPAVRRQPDTPRLRRVRRGAAGIDLAPLLDRGGQGRGPLAAVSLRLAVRARPDGAARGDVAPRALGRLGEGAVHERERQARLGLGEAGVTSATGVLLVGGASSRFGSPKALARLRDETLAERAWRILGEAFEARLAVGKGDVELPFPVVVEPAEPQAPLVGVIAGLRAAATETAVFLPVDCPLVTPALLRELGERGAVTQTGPLPGAYSKRDLPELERRLASDDWSLRGVNPRRLEADPRLLANVNTREDLSALERDLAALDDDQA